MRLSVVGELKNADDCKYEWIDIEYKEANTKSYFTMHCVQYDSM